ncbi:hypothetical protein TURU_150271 [Turdus rufiventris]|nr:hypothetical protein TURU_150271 [Turdus rufiventris]
MIGLSGPSRKALTSMPNVKHMSSDPEVSRVVHVVNPMVKKLSRNVIETTMKMEIKKKAAMLAQIKKAMLKMKEK